jgi:hypothetical protein
MAASQTNMTVANTILAQLGGNRFIAMTGAKDLLGSDNYLIFSIGSNPSKANKVKITLMPSDTYKMEFYYYSTPKMTKAGEIIGGLILIANFNDVYADNLRDIFTSVTKMHTSL